MPGPLEALRGLGIALHLLTRLPVPWPRLYRDGELGASLPWFPLVGALVGGIGGGLGSLLVGLGAPEGLGRLVAVFVPVLLTGALHEDGLADACDGLFGGRTAERRLEIMRDSRIGSFGALALVGAVVARWGALESLPPQAWAPVLAAAHAAGRLVTVRLLSSVGYARAEAPGLARDLATAARGGRLLVAHFLAVGLVVLLLQDGGALLLLWMLLVGAALGRLFRARVGGVTGDLLGAACVVVEVGGGWLLAWSLGVGGPVAPG